MTPFTPPQLVTPPAPRRARVFGIRMDGCQQPLEDLILQHLTVHHPETYTLVEIGSAGCVTLRAFADILREAGVAKWRALGIDLTPDKAWSLDMAEVERSFRGLPYWVINDEEAPRVADQIQGMVLMLLADPRAFLTAGHMAPIDFAFIDGSHGISCGKDFLAVEAKVAPGGLVVFHDYGEPEQGTDYQSHDREFISVRSYVHRLGLAEPRPAARKGWRFVGEIKGSRHWGLDGNSCCVVQRTDEPLASQPELSLCDHGCYGGAQG